MSVWANFAVVYLWGMCDGSMRSRTEFVYETELIVAKQQTNLSNGSSQMPHDISTCCGSYLYSIKFSWIINYNIREKATSAFLVHVHVAGFHVGPLLYLS